MKINMDLVNITGNDLPVIPENKITLGDYKQDYAEYCAQRTNLAGTFSDSSKKLLELNLTPKKRGYYLISYTMPFIGTGGTPYTTVYNATTKKYLSGTGLKCATQGNTTGIRNTAFGIVRITTNSQIQLVALINNATSYTIASYAGASFTAIEIF